jgi:hypothetical protein
MIDLRTLTATGVFGVVLSAYGLGAQGHAQYRDFQLGSDLASVATLSGVVASEAKVIHERPAVMKDLSWRPSYWISGSSKPQTDPVQQIIFSFYNDQLFRLVIDYDRQRTDGMTDGDMIQAISVAYGQQRTAKPRTTTAAVSPIETESGTPVGWWGDSDYSVVLYRSAYASAFRLLVTSPRLDALARTAAAQALRLDTREAPQRELARQQKEKEDARAAQEKAREANKALFRP